MTAADLFENGVIILAGVVIFGTGYVAAWTDRRWKR
jgi:hypothetical protein